MARSQSNTPKPLPAAEIITYPGFATNEWVLPPAQSGKVQVANNRSGGPFNMWYEVHGTGPTKLVWIMGLGALRTAWKRQTKYFGHEHASEYSTLVFDNRGMGLSDKPTCRYSTTEMALDLIELLGNIGWLPVAGVNSNTNQLRDLNVIGVSMGGMIAQEFALMVPNHIQSLSLVSTAPRLVRTIPFVENLRQRINMFIPRDVDVQLDEVAHRLFSSEFLAQPDAEQSDPKLNFPTIRDRFAAGELAKRMDTAGFTRKGFMLQAISAGWHHKTAEQLKELADKVGRHRIAVLHGTVDNMITYPHFKLFEQELGPGPEYRTWQGSGHVLFWENENEFNDCVEKLVKRTQKRT